MTTIYTTVQEYFDKNLPTLSEEQILKLVEFTYIIWSMNKTLILLKNGE